MCVRPQTRGARHLGSHVNQSEALAPVDHRVGIGANGGLEVGAFGVRQRREADLLQLVEGDVEMSATACSIARWIVVHAVPRPRARAASMKLHIAGRMLANAPAACAAGTPSTRPADATDHQHRALGHVFGRYVAESATRSLLRLQLLGLALDLAGEARQRRVDAPSTARTRRRSRRPSPGRESPRTASRSRCHPTVPATPWPRTRG